MKPLKLAVGASISIVLSTGLGQVSALALPPGAIPAGQYRNVSNEAAFNTFDPSTGSFASLSVFDTVRRAQPQGGPATTTETAQVSLDIFGNGISGGACYDISPTDFAFGSGSATLHTVVSAATTNCGGPAGPFPTPFTIDATWTGNAPVTGGQNLTHFDCGAYAMEEMITSQLQGASAVLTITPIFATPLTASEFQLLRTDDEVIHAQGVQPDGCQPAPGIPGGAGPPPAGSYTSNLILAGASFFDPTTNNFAFFSVFDSTQVSNPHGGPSTSATQFQVNFSIQNNGQFAFGCFDLSPSNFSDNGTTSATLTLSIDQTTPTCFGGPTSLPPQTLTITWNGIAPVATQRNNADFTCLTYRFQGSGLTTTARAAATATLTPMFSAPFSTPDQGSLETSTSLQHAEGAQQPPCHL